MTCFSTWWMWGNSVTWRNFSTWEMWRQICQVENFSTLKKLVMWRNSPHDMFLHMINVEKICHMEKFLHMRKVEKICHVEKFISPAYLSSTELICHLLQHHKINNMSNFWCFVTFYAVLLQSLFFKCDLRYFVAKSVLSRFTYFAVEKNWAKNFVCGEKRTNMRYALEIPKLLFAFWDDDLLDRIPRGVIPLPMSRRT